MVPLRMHRRRRARFLLLLCKQPFCAKFGTVHNPGILENCRGYIILLSCVSYSLVSGPEAS